MLRFLALILLCVISATILAETNRNKESEASAAASAKNKP